MELFEPDGTSCAATTVRLLQRLRERSTTPLVVIWDNGAAHRGPEVREYWRTPDLRLRLVALPPYSPDFNPDAAIWTWIREEVTATTCFGTAEQVAAALQAFWVGVDARADEVKRRCRTALQALAFPSPPLAHPSSPQLFAGASMEISGGVHFSVYLRDDRASGVQRVALRSNRETI